MTEHEKRERIRRTLEATGGSWLLNFWGADADNQLDRIAQELGAFTSEYERRFRERPDPLSLLDQDPYKGKAFFQTDTLAASVEMKVMIWRVLQGCEILRVCFNYELEGQTDFSVVLRTPYGEEETYHGNSIWDFRVLRHFSATGVNGHLVLQGYYAFK